MYSNIGTVAYWINNAVNYTAFDCEVIKETEKAVQIKSGKISVWFPKSALEVKDTYATIKPWFIKRANVWVIRFLGM